MTVQELIEKLSKVSNKNMEVFFQDPNSHGGPFCVGSFKTETADEDEYPDDWNMPEGYTFVLLEN